MNVLKISLCAVAATAAMAGASTAFAADDTVALSYNVGAATDYVFRGVDQTPATGEAFGGVDAVIAKQFYAGVWVSNTGFSGASGVEGDIYAGWKPSLGPVGFDLGVISYNYTGGHDKNNDHDDYELKAGASIPLGGFTIGAVDFYGPDNHAFPTAVNVNGVATDYSDTNYIEADVSYTFKNKASFSAAFGNFQGNNNLGHYNTWNAGITYPITDKLSIDARYIGASPTFGGLNGALGGPIPLYNGGVATLKVSF
jgi:uncharacterized protein (TIGR02001 family)